MSGGVYGGDEVGAVVFDAGSYTFRAGYAGEEFPKVDIPSHLGVVEQLAQSSENGISMNNTANNAIEINENRPPNEDKSARNSKNYYIGTANMSVPRENMEISGFLKDGMVDDWDIFEQLLNYMYSKCLFTESKYHPVLFSEPPWNTKQKRETLIELMFEKYNAPAFFLCKNAVLAAYANGRSNALVLDSGYTHTSAVPVYDGYCLTQAIVKCPFGGRMISDQCKLMLKEQNIEVVPTYKIASKQPVGENESAVWTAKGNLPPVTKSYHDFMIQQVIEDLQASVLQLSDTPMDVESAEKLPAAPFEFPSGYSKEFHGDRMHIPEALFDLSYVKDTDPQTLMTVRDVAATSIGLCDIDIRANLYSGLIITGGNSLIQGFPDRLNHDLQAKCPPSCKLRVTSAPTTAERRYGAWIGGSILASLGSFQQMWVSRQDYEESGRGIVDKKCP